MSKYAEVETQYKDAELLCEALREMGYKPELHATAQHLTGYQGDKREETAEIIIPRSQVGNAANDVGFKKNANGTYGAIISQYDAGANCTPAWQKRLKSTYAEKAVMKQAKRGGLKFAGKTTVKGKVVLKFLKN